MKIGENIRKIRELKGFKQHYVAERLHLSNTAYGNIERNDADVTFSRLEQIAEVLEVSVGDIVAIPAECTLPSAGMTRTDEVQAYVLALEQAQKEIDYLKEHTAQLLQMLKENNEQMREVLLKG